MSSVGDMFAQSLYALYQQLPETEGHPRRICFQGPPHAKQRDFHLIQTMSSSTAALLAEMHPHELEQRAHGLLFASLGMLEHRAHGLDFACLGTFRCKLSMPLKLDNLTKL